MQTQNLSLPFLMPEQAQKHVTVNEALRALDILVQMRVRALDETTPPASPIEGAGYGIGTSPQGVWAERAGQLAFYQDGAWAYIRPQIGWRVWDIADQSLKVFDGTDWQNVVADTTGTTGTASTAGMAGTAEGGADNAAAQSSGWQIETRQIDHRITAATYNDTTLIIPDRALVLGITARVLIALGTNTKWQLGVSADATRYGSQIGGQADSTNIGVSSTPVAYYGDTPVRITAQSGSLQAGVIRLRLYLLRISLPAA